MGVILRKFVCVCERDRGGKETAEKSSCVIHTFCQFEFCY